MCEELTEETAIRVEHLSWRYEGAKDWTIKDLSFRLGGGQVLGLTGESGAGKTTLILALAGIIPQRLPGTFKGSVTVAGNQTHRDHISKIVQNVGVVFQDPDNQFTAMSVLDEIVFGLENIGLPDREIRARVDEVAGFVAVHMILDKHPYEISGGQKQRVAIASALALKPAVLLLDEPTTDLDPQGRTEVFQLIHKLKQAGQTMVVVEHESDELARVADYMILLNQGHIVMEGPTHDFYSQVEDIMKYGVAPPQPTEFFSKLGKRGFSGSLPLTVEDGTKRLAELQLDRSDLSRELKSLSSKLRHDSRSPVIEVRDAEFTYPDGTKALSGVNLTIHDGEYIALVGQNGSGKTTLAKLLNGLLKPTKGYVKVDGLDARTLRTAELAPIVGYCFQNPDHQLFERTVYDEIALGPRELGLSEAETKARVEQALEVMGLRGFEKEHPFFLGKGQRLRLAVATVLALNSKILVVDEPTTGQDWRHSKDLMLYLDRLNREQKKTVLTITHHMRYVAEHANRSIVMANGEIVLDGPTRDVFSQVEKLNAASVAPPPITQMFQLAGFADGAAMPVSVEEAYRVVSACLKQ